MRLLAVLLVLGLLIPLAMVSDASPQKEGKRRAINLGGATSTLPFSDAIQVGDTLYLSGRIGLDPKTGQAPADLDTEMQILFDGMKATLKEAGMTMDDLVYVQVFCTDLSLYDKFNAAYRAHFTKDFPARAFIGSGHLLRGGHFEIQAIAVKR